jgi:hypothetical protein
MYWHLCHTHSCIHTHTHTQASHVSTHDPHLLLQRSSKTPYIHESKTNAVTRKRDKRERKMKERRRSRSLQMNTLLKTWWAAPSCTLDLSNLFATNARRWCRNSGRDWGESEYVLHNTFLSSALMSPSPSPRSTSQMRRQEWTEVPRMSVRSHPVGGSYRAGQGRAGQSRLSLSNGPL